MNEFGVKYERPNVVKTLSRRKTGGAGYAATTNVIH